MKFYKTTHLDLTIQAELNNNGSFPWLHPNSWQTQILRSLALRLQLRVCLMKKQLEALTKRPILIL